MAEGAQAETPPDDGSGTDRPQEHQDEPGDLQGKVAELGVIVRTYEGSPESIRWQQPGQYQEDARRY